MVFSQTQITLRAWPKSFSKNESASMDCVCMSDLLETFVVEFHLVIRSNKSIFDIMEIVMSRVANDYWQNCSFRKERLRG